jgi:dTDP-4-amino-4,6-dideoxygalactose transaminase
MKVPFVNLKPLSQRLKSKVIEDWAEVLENTEFVGGPSVQKLESELAQRLEVPHVVTCANGTDALILALQALDVGPGDRVAVPNLTFWATSLQND